MCYELRVFRKVCPRKGEGDQMKVIRKIIKIDEELCDGCGECVTSCEEGAIQIINEKAKVINDVFCDGLGACIGDCPQGALEIVEREAEAFNEEAVKVHLESQQQVLDSPLLSVVEEATMACGCSSKKIQTFSKESTCDNANRPTEIDSATSALGHWPVQISLVPPNAPFLKDSDLQIVADCVPVAYPNFHKDFLRGKSVMIGCPKFDDGNAYANKFADIFRTSGIRSITIVIMEVPCCSGLPQIVKKGLELSGMKISLEEVVISIREGKIISRNPVFELQN